MRKSLTSALACALSLALLGGALAAPGDALLFVPDQGMWGSTPSIDMIAALGDTLFMSNYESLYAYRVGDAEPTGLTYDEASQDLLSWNRRMVSDGKALYLLSYGEQGALYELRVEDGVASLTNPIELDWADLVESYDGSAYSREIADALFIGGDLYVLCESADYSQLELMCFDLESGGRRDYDLRGIYAICAYKEGCALFMLWDNQDWEKPTRLAAMDLSTGEVRDLAALPDGTSGLRADGLAYDADSDLVYYLLNGTLYAWQPPAEALALASAPLEGSWRGTTGKLLDGGYYAYGNKEGVIVRNTDPALKASRTLTMRGHVPMDKAYQAFAAAHPDVDVILNRSYSSGDEVQAMMSGSSAVDIYALDVSSTSFAAMLGRGYAADLSGSAKIAESVGQMYPHIREALSREGKILAVPTAYNVFGWGYHAENLKKLGLTEEDLPATYAELCDLLNRWPNEFGRDFPEMLPVEPYMLANLRSALLNQLTSDYAMYMAHSGQEMQLNTPLFRQALASIEGIDRSLYPAADENEGYAYSADDLLIETYYTVTLGGGMYSTDMEPLNISLAENLQALSMANMSVYLVNPYSKNIDLAIEYLECLLDNADPLLMANLIPTRNEPIPNPNYDKLYADYQEALAQIQEMAEQAPEEEKQVYEMARERQAQYLVYIEQRRWLASEADIARYRAQAERAVLLTADILGLFGGDSGREIYSFIERYLNSQLSAEQMISGIDQKIRMMRMEAAY